MQNAVSSNVGRPFSPPHAGRPFPPGQGRPFSPIQHPVGPGRPFSPSRQGGPGRPFSPSRQDGPGRPFSPSRQDGPCRPFSPSQPVAMGPGRPFSPNRQDGPPASQPMSGVAISRPFPSDQKGARPQGPVASGASPGPRPRVMPKPTLPAFLAGQLNTGQAGAASVPGPAPMQHAGAAAAAPGPRYPQHQPMMGTQHIQQQQMQRAQQSRAPMIRPQQQQPRVPFAPQQQQQQQQPRAPVGHPQQQLPRQQQQTQHPAAASAVTNDVGAVGPQYPGAVQQQQQQHAATGPQYPSASAYQQHQQQQPQMAHAAGGAAYRAPGPIIHQQQQLPGQGSQAVLGGTVYMPRQQQKEPMWMWSMKDMLPPSQQNREFSPYSMPASPTSPGPDQWGALQPYSLPTSPTPLSLQNMELAPPQLRENASSPVRQMAALFDRSAQQPQGSLQFVARKRLQPWKKPSVSLAGKQHLGPLDEPGRAYSPKFNQPALSTSAAQPAVPFHRVLSPSIEGASELSRVMSPTRQIQQVPSARVMSPTQQIYGVGAPVGGRVLSPTRQLGQQPQPQPPPVQRVFSPTRQLDTHPLRVFSPTKDVTAPVGPREPVGGTPSGPQFARVFSPTKRLDVTASPPTKKAGLGAKEPAPKPRPKTPTSASDSVLSIDRRQPYMLALQPPSILKQAREEKYKEANKRIEEALANVPTTTTTTATTTSQSPGHAVHFSDSTKFSGGGPVDRPITPYSHDTEPWKRPVTPADRPTTPYEGLRLLFDRPTTPYDKPLAPYGAGKQPPPHADRPTTPIFVQVDDFDKPAQRPVTPLERPTTPATNPLVRPNYGRDRPTTPADRPTAPGDTVTSRGNYPPSRLSMECGVPPAWE